MQTKLSEAQMAYLKNVLGLEGLIVPEIAAAIGDPVTTDELIDETEIYAQVHATGPRNARLLVLIASTTNALPLDGEVGDLTEKMIRAMKIDMSEVRVLQWLKADTEKLSPEVLGEIESSPLILIFGERTLQSINDQIVRAGEWTSIGAARALVTYDPSMLLREPERKKVTWAHLQMLMKELR